MNDDFEGLLFFVNVQSKLCYVKQISHFAHFRLIQMKLEYAILHYKLIDYLIVILSYILYFCYWESFTMVIKFDKIQLKIKQTTWKEGMEKEKFHIYISDATT